MSIGQARKENVPSGEDKERQTAGTYKGRGQIIKYHKIASHPSSFGIRLQALENVGLKWSMLATTSWESMYDTLCEYVDSKVGSKGLMDNGVCCRAHTRLTFFPSTDKGRRRVGW